MATSCKEYDFNQIEPHWQQAWEQSHAFKAANLADRPKYYLLDMFPYPSGAGLHLGHCENYAITDIMARYKRARGFNVLFPIGWDAFGLPTENYAVKTGRHPADVTRENIDTFRRQLKSIGVSYDFSREVNTTDPAYFRWTQWIWLQLFQRGLAYVEEKPVWWCPALGTVLANEEVIDGLSEVGKHPVERRPMRQWVLRITAYADRLLADLEKLDWPDSTKRMQAAWIGRSEGSEVEFDIVGLPGERLKIFTTRVDTIYGATYMVVAPEHRLVSALTTPAQRAAVEAYVKAAASKSDLERTELAKDKSGVFTGTHAINPATGAQIPIWIADYVLASYGTGAIMAVPAHDERDFEFAGKFQLPIPQVIAPADGTPVTLPFCDKGGDVRLIASGDCTGLTPIQAKERLDARFAAENRGRATIQFKLRDWLFSRQRYWGEPFPIVWISESDYRAVAAAQAGSLVLPATPVTCLIDGEIRCALPLPNSALPLQLPEVKSYQPTGTGESPLAAITEWLEIWYQPATGACVPVSQECPGAGWIRGRRETNTMPQWAGSCWYYLRYLDPQNADALASPEALKYWGMPDLYVGGAEHAVLHLLYARFWHKVLFDLGVVPTDEPFTKLFHQGIILGEDGEKMSKSRGNVANPDEVIRAYGADTLRLYLMFLGPLEAMKPWNPKGIEGVHRFLQKVWRECIGEDGSPHPKISGKVTDAPEVDRLLHETIKKVGEDIETLHYNTSISQMMIFVNAVQKAPAVSRQTMLAFLQVLAPFAPHIANELWSRLGGQPDLNTATWPVFDPAKLVSTEIKLVFQVNGKHRGDQLVPVDITQDAALKLAGAHERVAPHLQGKAIKRIIFVPRKILNIVVE
ncbi:MAG TPA: leucine--tRNA ligase [Opitutaceae bacterium]|nr:leucine--tRNA ligase [Opitutaceae bacterium]HRJ45818.1 leucine--tRNA ligase [Opitutaceae bacterium]